MTLRSIGLAAVLGLSGAGCFSPYYIQPATGGAVAVSSNAALTLRVTPNAWVGDPLNLDGFLTPLAIEVENGRADDLWISYSDFALIDDQGVRHRVISPYSDRARPLPKPATKPPAPKPRSPAIVPAAPGPVEPSDGDGGLDDSWRDKPRNRARASGQMVLVEYIGEPPARIDVADGPAIPRARRGLGYAAYGPFVDRWDDRHYPEAPSYDVLRLGLTEGLLGGGERVSGFIYFENAATQVGRLELTFTARTLDDRTVATVQVSLLARETGGPSTSEVAQR
jgi:hypothetical protein